MYTYTKRCLECRLHTPYYLVTRKQIELGKYDEITNSKRVLLWSASSYSLLYYTQVPAGHHVDIMWSSKAQLFCGLVNNMLLSVSLLSTGRQV